MADVLPSDELIDEPSDFGALRPGTRLGRYELLVPIARGGMARVWAARLHGQRGFQKLVAIKTILPHLADEAEFERMFLDEARIAAGVHHPNVCEIYELGEERKTLYLAMEWVSGDSLSRVLRPAGKTEGIDARVAARILADACAGAHAAHELTDEDGRQLGVVHRDLSPHNVLLSADGVVKVCDFGVAKALGQLHEQTSAGQLKGKISYMSPEQITGGAIDRRSDVFSLGCVLYEATTGVRPFKGEHDHQIMHAVMTGTVTAPSSFIKNYPQELERIVLRALSQKPILRYPTAERMRFALEEFLTKGSLVTSAQAAQIVRARIGPQLDRRKERIKQAQSLAEQAGWDPSKAPSTRDPNDPQSGVKEARPVPPQKTVRANTLQMAIPKPSELEPRPQPAPTPRLSQREPVAGPSSGDLGRPASVPPSMRAIPTRPIASSHPSASTIPASPAAFADSSDNVLNHAPPPSTTDTLNAPTLTMSVPDAGTDWSSPGVSHTAAMASAVPSHPPQHGLPPPSHPIAAPTHFGHHEDREAGAGSYFAAAFIGLLIAVVIGGGGFFLWQRRERPAPPVLTTPSTSVAASTGEVVPSEIAIVVTPSSAALTVDDRPLAVGQRSFPRPRSGQSVTLVARATGFESASVVLDSATPTPLTIDMKPVLEVDLNDALDAGAAVAPITSSAAKAHKPKPKDPNALPDNPY